MNSILLSIKKIQNCLMINQSNVDNQQIKEIIQCLQEKDENLLTYLLQGQNFSQLKMVLMDKLTAEQYNILQKCIKDIQQQPNQQIQSKIIPQQHYQQQNLSENQSSVLFQSFSEDQEPKTQNKKKSNRTKCITETQIGYPYYSVIKRQMIACGNINPSLKSVKMMHSQIQTLFCQLFTKEIIPLLLKKQKINPILIERYLEQIFSNQYFDLKRFLSFCKNTKSTLKHQDKQYHEEQQFLQKQEQKQKKHDLLFHNTQQEKQYLASLAIDLNEQQLKKFSKNRYINFLSQGTQFFSRFLSGSNDTFVSVKKRYIFQMLSFFGCRFIRRLMFTIIRKQNHGNLINTVSNQFTQQDIKYQGNILIAQYVKKVKQYHCKHKNINYDELAFETFQKQIKDHQLKKLIPKEVFDSAQKNKQLEQTIGRYIWNHYPQYKKLWTQRVISQNWFLRGQTPKKKIYNYYTYICNNEHQFIKRNGHLMLWIKYLNGNISDNIEVQEQENNQQQYKDNVMQNKTMKRKKLESLSK